MTIKQISILCLAAFLAYACDKTEPTTPVYNDVAKVATVSEAQEALNQGSADVTISQPLTADATFTVPAGKDEIVSLTVPAAGKNVVVKTATGENAPALELAIDDAADLTIDASTSAVDFDGDVTGSLTATTANNVFTIAEGATVNSLTVVKGFVRVAGTVTNVESVAEGAAVLWPAATAADLQAAMTTEAYDVKTNGGVFLTADVNFEVADPSGAQDSQDAFRVGAAPTEADVQAHDGFVIDGNGFTMTGAAKNNVLAVYSDNVTVQNLTITQTAAQKEATASNGISAFEVIGFVLDNVTIKDCGKAGLVVNNSSATATALSTSGNAWYGVGVDKGTPTFTLVSGDIQEEYAIVAVEGADVTVPTGWTNQTAEGQTVYSPAE
jgi:hypothetical protein